MKLRLTNIILVIVTILAVAIFQIASHYRQPGTPSYVGLDDSKVVIAAPIQVLMYAGDRFLAADVEAARVAAIGASEEGALAGYRVRAHELVAQLNPCHEDNVYISNAMLSWGGAVDAGNAIMQRATDCRTWDDIPPFFLGFNRYFFYRDLDGARKAIDIAASRSKDNRATLQQMSIVIASKKLNDEKMAAEYLRSQRDQATDPILAEKLNRRLLRLEGLITLRDAQARFEKEHGHPLTNPNELITSGILNAFPQDPMRLGYDFANGSFRLRPLNIGGMEIR